MRKIVVAEVVGEFIYTGRVGVGRNVIFGAVPLKEPFRALRVPTGGKSRRRTTDHKEHSSYELGLFRHLDTGCVRGTR